MRFVVTGSSAFDRIMRYEGRLPDNLLGTGIGSGNDVLSVCWQVRSLDVRLGGAAGNIVHSMALLGLDPVVVGSVGPDFEPYAQTMRKKGLSLDGIRVMENEQTAASHILSDSEGNQITGFFLGAVACPAEEEFRRAISGADNVLAFISPGSRYDIPRYVDIARQEQVPYVLDTGQTTPDHTGEELAALMDGAYLFIANEYEMRLAERSTGLDVRGMLELAHSVIVTRGQEGATVWTRERETVIPAVPPFGTNFGTNFGTGPGVKNGDKADIDPTGAGDAFRAGLAYGFSRGCSLPDCARLGAVCASFAVEHSGGQEHVFTLDEFTARCRRFFGPL